MHHFRRRAPCSSRVVAASAGSMLCAGLARLVDKIWVVHAAIVAVVAGAVAPPGIGSVVESTEPHEIIAGR